MKAVRILVVDDNEDHRFFIKRALDGVERIQLDVVMLPDGQEALAYLQRVNGYSGRALPHLILLDIRMPRMSGLEVLQQIKQDPDLRRIPVCILTSSDRREDVDNAFQLGSNSYVVKASDVDGIRREVQAVCDFFTSTSQLPEPPG